MTAEVNPGARIAVATIDGVLLSSGTTASLGIAIPAEYAPEKTITAPLVDTNAGRAGWAWVSTGGNIRAHAPSSPSGSAWYGQIVWTF